MEVLKKIWNAVASFLSSAFGDKKFGNCHNPRASESVKEIAKMNAEEEAKKSAK